MVSTKTEHGSLRYVSGYVVWLEIKPKQTMLQTERSNTFLTKVKIVRKCIKAKVKINV